MERRPRAGRDLERKIRERERQRLRRINNQGEGVLGHMIRAVLIAAAVLFGTVIWIWAAGRQAEMEAQAAVLRSHRITDGSMYSWGPGVTPGQNQNNPIMVEPLPEIPPEDGAPPVAIEIKYASKADAIPDNVHESEEDARWESLGVWKLTAYCPLECCNGKGRAWKTASEIPMVIGETVATARLPFGTKLKVRDHIYTVTDRGTPYGTLDILHESDAVCYEFGIQYAEVFILR